MAISPLEKLSFCDRWLPGRLRCDTLQRLLACDTLRQATGERSDGSEMAQRQPQPTARHSSRDMGSRVPSKIVDKNTGKAYRTGKMLGKVTRATSPPTPTRTHSCCCCGGGGACCCCCCCCCCSYCVRAARGLLTWRGVRFAAGWLRDSVPVLLPEHRHREGRQGRRALQHPRLQVEAEGGPPAAACSNHTLRTLYSSPPRPQLTARRCPSQQLYAEIQIHKAVSQGGNSHINVLNFLDWFEDRDNVYMMVELCHKGVRAPRRHCHHLAPPVLRRARPDRHVTLAIC